MPASITSTERESENQACGNPLRFSQVRSRSSTHAPQHASAMADHVMLMFGAEDYAIGTATDVLSEVNLERLYGVPVCRADDADGRTVGFLPVLSARSR